MFRDLIGLQEQIANKVDAVLLERKAHADCRIGRQLSAMSNGFQEDFLGKVLLEIDDVTDAFTTRALAVTAATTYALMGASKHFVVEAGTNTAATAGIVVPDGTTRRGLLGLRLGNVANAGIGFHQEDVYWLHSKQNFEMKVALDACAGLDNPSIDSATWFGVCGELVADGVTAFATNPSLNYLAVEISGSKARIVSRDDNGAGAAVVTTSPWIPFQFLSGRIVVGLMWGASGRTAHLTINDKVVQSLQLPKLPTGEFLDENLQIFGKVAHSATYDATPVTGDTAVQVNVEAIQVVMYNNAAAPFRSE